MSCYATDMLLVLLHHDYMKFDRCSSECNIPFSQTKLFASFNTLMTPTFQINSFFFRSIFSTLFTWLIISIFFRNFLMDATLMSSFILIIILKFPNYKFSVGKKLSHFCNIEFWMNRSEICVKFAVKILKKLLYVMI